MNLTSISCLCAPIMKQTLPREKQPSAINQAAWNQHRTNGERMEGRENFRFAGRTNSHARGGCRGARNSTRFPPSSAPTSAISRGNEMKKWRANSHNKADNRAIKITFARPKKAKRNQKREGKKENFVSHPPPFYGHLGARVEKFLLCGNHLRFAAPPRRPNHAFSKHELCVYTHKE